MRLTRHREEFNLGMSSNELVNLAELLKGYQKTIKTLADQVKAPTVERLLEEYLHELTRYQEEAYAYDRYLEKEHQ
jgi:hypothetical protein